MGKRVTGGKEKEKRGREETGRGRKIRGEAGA